jgi:hypothetical protein
MATLTATPRTITIPAPVKTSQPRPADAVQAARPTPARPGFCTVLLRALAASAA